MSEQVRQLVILGLTHAGARFRPSDWAERLAGVLSRFRPANSGNSTLTYSPYVVPSYVDGVRCVQVDARLRDLEPLAWRFVCGFAQDNQLQTREHGVAVQGGAADSVHDNRDAAPAPTA